MSDMVLGQQISELVLRGVEGTLDAEGARRLSEKIATDPEAAEQYIELVAQHAMWRRSGLRILGRMRVDRAGHGALLAQVVEEEWEQQEEARRVAELERAQGLCRAAEETLGLYQQQERQREQEALRRQAKRRKRNRFLLMAAVLVAAISYGAHLAHQVLTRPPVVARVLRVAEAAWIMPGGSDSEMIKTGASLRPGLRQLERGYVELEFTGGAIVGIRAPATFRLVTGGSILMATGRLMARVDGQVKNFCVDTPACQVVDLGTEFGVDVMPDGSSEVHVVEGKVSFTPGAARSEVIRAGRSLHVQADGSGMTELEFKGVSFASDVRVGGGGVWRGQSLDLADVVGGGRGFGTGRMDYGVDPCTGRMGEYHGPADREGPWRYVPVAEHPYIDGVFVPDGSASPVEVSSQGHAFADCPDTVNLYYSEITNGTSKYLDPPGTPTILRGVEYGTAEHPGVLMHANVGITFDLAAIRSELHGVRIESFEAVCGITEVLPEPRVENADIWVLVDGEVKFRLSHTKMGTVSSVRVDLADTDRFLTLITTDGGDPSEMLVNAQTQETVRATHFDWCMFGEPRLTLSPVRMQP